MVATLSKFTVLFLSYFLVYFLKSKLILFHNRVVYCYARIFVIFLPHPHIHTHTYIYIYIYMHVSLNIIDISCLHIVFFIDPFMLPY